PGDYMNPEDLKNIEVLDGIDHQALVRLSAVVEQKDCSPGQVVFAEGDPGDSMYFITKGSIRIEKRAQQGAEVNKTLAILQSGDYFCEMALLDQKPRSASAAAVGEVRL